MGYLLFGVLGFFGAFAIDALVIAVYGPMRRAVTTQAWYRWCLGIPALVSMCVFVFLSLTQDNHSQEVTIGWLVANTLISFGFIPFFEDESIDLRTPQG